ncbi:MAG: plasmid partitioning protein RepB, partial [Roseiarcus sp.]
MANSSPGRPDQSTQRVPAGPVRSMGLALDRIEQESRALQEALATGASVVELDPDLIDPSIVRDRLPESGAATFEALKQSIAERGQEVPILVRPHPTRDERYQVAFGHRRLRAVAALGRKVRAVVRAMSDIELVVAQGVENSQREDLSYIERALFAARLEDRGFARTVIIDALATDKTELSKLISVARAVPESVIDAIGPAPKAGRRRWLAFVELLQTPSARRSVEQASKDPNLAQADTDTRFVRILAAASTHARAQSTITNWKSSTGRASAKVTRTGKAINLAFDSAAEPEFADFIASQLDHLYATFLSRAKASG